MDDIMKALAHGLNQAVSNLRSLEKDLDNETDVNEDQEVFLSVMLSQPLEESEEKAKEFNLSNDQGVLNMSKRAAKDRIFSKKVYRCVSRLNK